MASHIARKAVKSRPTRLETLKRFMLDRQWSFLPPSSQEVIPKEIFKIQPRTIDNFTATRVPSNASEDTVSKITSFYKNQFLKDAPLPNALGLHYRFKTSSRVNEYLDKEFDFHIRSGMSFIVKDANDAIVAGNTSVCWARDDSYKGVENASFLEWFNMAAEIINESDDPDPALIWRDYQFMAQYNCLQLEMKKHDRTFGMWNNHLYVAPPARKNLKVFLLMVDPMQQIITNHGGIIGGGTSHKHVTKRYLQTVPNNITEHSIPYSELDLILDGKRAFAPHEKLGEMHFSIGGARKDV